ncbi:MAG: hypothetical protein EOO71_19590 [Myxococcaceae bacterium]|nr:MAG: hypothetical protein EOO71_19590 [Myxococcaceae bacterium]
MRASILGGVLATALMVGCGPAMEQEEAQDLSTQESPLPDCSGSPDNLTMYFKDAAHSEQIGGRGCHCGWWNSWGKTSPYTVVLNEC